MTAAAETEPVGASPVVTIAIPTFNRPFMLRDCLSRLLDQVGPDVEVLVCDDASVDETASVLAAFSHPRLRVSRNSENLGLFGNFNQCVALAAGEFVVVLSDDDLIDDDLVPSCLALLRADSDASGDPVVALIASNRYLTVTADGQRYVSAVEGPVVDGFYAGDEILRHLWSGAVSFQLCGVLFRTAALRAIGGFARGHKYAGDIRTYAALFFGRRVGFVAAPKCTYVVHQQSESTALGVRYRLSDLSSVFGTILDDARQRLGPTRADLVAASIRRYMTAEYLRNTIDFRAAGGSRWDSMAAAAPGLRWIAGRGSNALPVVGRFLNEVLLPRPAREFVWTTQRFIRRLRAR